MNKQPKNKSDSEIYDRILHDIIVGSFEPGEKLNETDLALKLRISRTPLRENLFQLESDGFLKYETNKGFRVPILSKDELRECYPIIWCLEKEALSQGFLILHAQISELKEINKNLEKARKPDAILACDKKFHDTIVAASDNRTLQEILNKLKLRMQRYDLSFFASPALVRQSYDQHDGIISCVKEQNRTAALDALQANWEVGLKYLLSRM